MFRGLRDRFRLVELGIIRRWAGRHECVVSNVGEAEIHDRIMDILVHSELMSAYIRECLIYNAFRWHSRTDHEAAAMALLCMDDIWHRMGTADRHVADFLMDALSRMPPVGFEEACKCTATPRHHENQPRRDPAQFPETHPVEPEPIPVPPKPDPRSVMIRIMVDNLNRLMEMDPVWCRVVFPALIKTNDAVARSDGFAVEPAKNQDESPAWGMTAVGMLNGILGPGREMIASDIRTSGPLMGQLVGFAVVLFEDGRVQRIIYPEPDPAIRYEVPDATQASPDPGDQLRFNYPPNL